MSKEKISPYQKAIEEIIKVDIKGEPYKQVLRIITNMYEEYNRTIENLKTSHNNDFKASAEKSLEEEQELKNDEKYKAKYNIDEPSPKLAQIFYICPKCKGRCIERKIGKSKVYDCQSCRDQISKEAVIVKKFEPTS